MRRSMKADTVLRAILVIGVTISALAPGVVATPPTTPWPQWGGPGRDFKVNTTGLAEQWPAQGPIRLWTRPLGEGYSPIVGDLDRVYTMYRQGGDEVVIALRGDNGQTVWEHRCFVKPHPDQTEAYGQGPNAAPLLLGDRLVTVGFTGVMHCLDAKTGELLWGHDLVKDFNGGIQYYGFANSPIAYKGNIITPVGGEDHGVIALSADDGSLIWKSPSCDISYAAPVMINVDGQDQFVFFSPSEVMGLDPRNGSFLWSHPVANFCRTNCTSVIWGEDNLLWAATKGVGGTRVLKLTQHNGKTDVKEVWLNRKIRVYHWNAIRVGDYVYTSTGDSSKFLSVIDIKTGKIVQRKRGFGGTNAIYADGKLVILDDSGKLALVTASPEKITVLSSAQLLDSVTWTPPTLVGKTLYVRDRESIMALDLGRPDGGHTPFVMEKTSDQTDDLGR